jgi:GT2 family glycosyltransferase
VAPVIPTIIIPVISRYDLLERCLASIPDADTVIVIDNGDYLDISDYDDYLASGLIDGIKSFYVWSMPTNLGVATSWNLGIKATPFSSGWLLLNSDAHFVDYGFATLEDEARHDNVVLAGNPPWCCAWIGRQVVRDVGLFCERFHPAYFEDNDYEKRCEISGVSIVRSQATVAHDNSSTLASSESFRERNAETFHANLDYFQRRWASVDATGLPVVAEWDLRTRVANSWDPTDD